MKTYNIIYVLLALVIIGCSSSEEGKGGEEIQNGVDVDYALLLTTSGQIKTQLLTANGEEIALNEATSAFPQQTVPQLSVAEGSTFFQYHTLGDCSGKITRHDFDADTTMEYPIFDDLNDCTLTAHAVSFSDDMAFIAYEVEIDSKVKAYFVRIIDLDSADTSFVDITLDKKPVHLAVANNRLFVLTLDIEITDENSLSVVNLDSKVLIHEMDLGYGAQRVFKNMQGNIIISYDELHTTLNSGDFSFKYTQYEDGTEPKFTAKTTSHFDLDGKLYYPIAPGSISSYPKIPAVYDFSEDLVVLYAFENFLTEEKRDSEYKIETTTAVTYDKENNLILVGYKKIGQETGGILRIKPVPEPRFIDNIDLPGIPYEIFIK